MPRWQGNDSDDDRFRLLPHFSILREIRLLLRKIDNGVRAFSCSFACSRAGTVITAP